MHVLRINITLPLPILKKLQSAIPQGKRSQFIAEAVSEKLQKKKPLKISLKKSLEVNKEFYKNEYKIWKVTESDGLDKI